MVETKNLIKKYYNFDIYFTLGPQETSKFSRKKMKFQRRKINFS